MKREKTSVPAGQSALTPSLRKTFSALVLAVTALAFSAPPLAAADDTVRLTVKEVPLTVNGKTVNVMAIQQADGQSGYSPQKKDGFHVEVLNTLTVPTCIHWHGLILPNLMDGVPFVTQEPIPPGGTFAYNFPLVQEGSYWMHSHYGLQEQLLNSAPLIIWTPREKALADVQHVVMLSDFSFTSPVEILKKLKSGMNDNSAEMGDMKMSGTSTETKGSADNMTDQKPPAKKTLFAQVWDESSQRFTRGKVQAETPDIDVQYDALLANRRTIEDPEVVPVKRGQTVLLRLIAASSATDFYVDTGALNAELLAVDGHPVEPLWGNYFQLAVAQRIDLRVTIPPDGDTFPIIFQGEGTKLQAAIVLVPKGSTAAPALSAQAALPTAALDNLQEKKLRAVHPLTTKKADRTFPAVLGGTMSPYVWTINGAAYPNHNSFDVKEGERVEIVMTNTTSMGHPMHLHGHVFQVVEIDGQPIRGAMRDTVEVPSGSTIKIAFDANNPGVWAFHCHILYHLATGMFTVVKYEGADTKFWQPEKSVIQDKNSIPAAPDS